MGNYFLSSKTGIKASLTRNVQYLHRPVLNEINLPQDVWLPADYALPPQSVWQTTLGLSHELSQNVFVSIEGYYKQMHNIFALLPYGALGDLEFTGEGSSYGSEFFIKKQKGNWGGWLSYTLSKTDREFENESLESIKYTSRFDRRHDLKIYGYYRLNEHWNVSLNGVYGSPMPRLFADANSDNTAELFYNRPIVRSEPYHRVDVGVSYFKKRKKTEHTIKLSVYNIYNQKNPTFYRGINNPRPVYLLKRTPGVYYGVKF
jgi:hypothetical protein